MKELAIIATYLIGLGEVLLGLFFWKTNGNQIIRKILGFLAIVTGAWVLSTVGAAYTENATAQNLLPRLTYAFGVFMVTAVLLFSLLFPLPIIRIDRFHIFLLFIPAIIFSFEIFGTNTVLNYYVSSSTFQGAWHGGPLFQYYNIYLIALYTLAIGILLYRLRKADVTYRHTLLPVALSFVLGGLPGVINDLIIPLFTGYAKDPLYGTSATLVWLGVTSYIVLKK